MKRILSLIIGITFIIGVVPFSASAADDEGGILKLLAELNIMSGDPDGNMRLDDYVSRAEFTKIAVAASSYKNSVAANLAISPFPDVTYKHWAAPYVRVGVTSGIVSGYPDATFKPEDTVLYEEAITMLLRVLGYSDTDFGVSWPSGQIGLANNIDMTDNINCNTGDIMNRRQVAMLVYNTLKTKQKNSQSRQLSVFDAVMYEDTTLVASSNEDSAVASDEIYTTSGTYKINTDFDKSDIGKKGDIVVKDSSKVIAFVTDSGERAAEEYIVYSVLSDKLMAYRNGSITQLKIDNDTPVYKGKGQTTFAALKSQLELGDRLIVRLADTGDIDYVTYGQGDVAGPITAMSGNWKATWGIDGNVSVARNGSSAKETDIAPYDIVYYLRELNTVLAYTNKVTGIYEKATPNKDVPVTVTVSGVEYDIEGSSAFNKLYSGGMFEYGDTVTLLLGRGGNIADVITPSAASDGVVGYLTQTGTKNYSSGDIDTYTSYYLNIVQTDGVSYEYITDKDYSENVNSVVELSFSGGYARISAAKSNAVTGKVDWYAKRIGSAKLSPQVEILDIGSKGVSDASAYVKIFGQRIDGVTLNSSSVLYAEKNSSDEITKLILNNVTNDSFSYGIVTSADYKAGGAMSAGSGSYDYIAGGNRYSISINGKYNASRGSVVKISGAVSRPDSISSIESVGSKITSISSDRLVADNKTYKISDKVDVYKKQSLSTDSYTMISLDDVISNKDKYTISAYYDKPSDSGGRIRIITVIEK